MRELKAFVYLHASSSRSWMAVPDSKYTYYSPRKVLRFETGEVGAGANSSAQHVHPHSTVERHSIHNL